MCLECIHSKNDVRLIAKLNIRNRVSPTIRYKLGRLYPKFLNHLNEKWVQRKLKSSFQMSDCNSNFPKLRVEHIFSSHRHSVIINVRDVIFLCQLIYNLLRQSTLMPKYSPLHCLLHHYPLRHYHCHFQYFS